MDIVRRSRALPRPSLAFVLLLVFLAVLLLGGGASRADAPGQLLVRGAAWAILVIAALLGGRPDFTGSRPILILVIAAAALPLLQLVPLPPGVWQMLPGREMFAEAAAASGQSQPWRPWSLVPGATLNAAASLVVPATTLVLLASLKDSERQWLPGALLALVVASMLAGLVQFSGARLDNPLINDTVGQVSGTFANRNHFALFLAFGCLLAPVWAFLDGRRPHWRGPIALGLILLLAMTILATGSRAGILLEILALGVGLLLVRQGIKRELARFPRWVFPVLIAAIIGMIATVVLLSVAADRAVSIDRVFGGDPGQDMRTRGLPTVLAMIREYFPMGSGLGGFDPIFRIHEPHELLKPTYFNHAHNDLLEIVLDAGLPGAFLLLAGIGWFVVASIQAWRVGAGSRHALPRLGSTMLLLVLIASAFDYPARTPIIMAFIIIAGFWLIRPGKGPGSPALPPYK